MTILIISMLVLGLGVVLMKEYGWADLTGSVRNELVFEKRNKSYGAYEIRQKYSNRLLISFVAMLGFISIAAVSPRMFMHTQEPTDGHTKGGPVVVGEIEKPIEKEEVKKDEVIENHEKKQQQKNTGAPTEPDINPVATDKKVEVDSTKNDKAILSNIKSKGDSTSTTYFPPVKNPGNGTKPCLDCDKDTTEYTEAGVDKKAEFDYMRYISKNLHLPDLSEMNIKSGKIHISFVVDEKGNVSSASVKRGMTPELDKEALRVISSMPKWEPALKNGKPVKVRMIVPIKIVVE